MCLHIQYRIIHYTVHYKYTVFSWVSTSKAIRWYVCWNRIRAHRFSSGKGWAELATARCSSDQADLTMTKNKILQALARCSKTWSISYWNCALCTGGGGGVSGRFRGYNATESSQITFQTPWRTCVLSLLCTPSVHKQRPLRIYVTNTIISLEFYFTKYHGISLLDNRPHACLGLLVGIMGLVY